MKIEHDIEGTLVVSPVTWEDGFNDSTLSISR